MPLGHGVVIMGHPFKWVSRDYVDCHPLIIIISSGVARNGKIRCPWHGACFNVANGDMEDFPGFGPIPSYEVND